MSPRSRDSDARSASVISWVLVGLQGGILLAIVAVPASWGPSVQPQRVVGAIVVAAGGAGALAAVAFLGRALTPVPEPNGAGLSARGVYAWARHPMYGSVMIGALGVSLLRGAAVSLLLVGALVVLFEFKTRREERFLIAAYPGYADYAARTGKYLPWWGRRSERRTEGGSPSDGRKP